MDDETGLLYNRFRYFDPDTAAYISKDPIGLAGGLEAYAYVRDPLAWVDPLGLAPWSLDPLKDLDWRGGAHSFKEALEEAFRRTGVPKESFKVSMWERDVHGKTAPVEWTSAEYAIVNVDDPTIVPTSSGPQAPHVGYQRPGKRPRGGMRGHILLDSVPATRPGLGSKKACK